MTHPTLRKALEERSLLVCVGPLVSARAGIPGRRELVDGCMESLDRFADARTRNQIVASARAGELARALGVTSEKLPSGVFDRLIGPALDRADAPLPLIVRALADLAPSLQRICTTNLDALLERALDRWPAYESEPEDLAAKRRCILKLCGSAPWRSSWVLTDRQLARRLRELPQTVDLMRTHTLLLLGYRADDDVLHSLVLELRRRSGSPPWGVAWIPVERAEVDAAPCEHLRELREHGIEIVPIAGDYDVGVAERLHALVDATGSPRRRREVWERRYEGWADPRGNPYPGLDVVTGRSTDRLHGRRAEIQRALELILARPSSRWLLVHGPEGVGKSSFLAAGLLPAITGGDRKRRVLVVHGDARPLWALAYAIRRSQDMREDVTVDDVHAKLRDASALTDLIALRWPEGLILVVDSLEYALSAEDADEREGFAASLAHALQHAPAAFLLITGVRSGALGDLHRLPRLHERMLGADPPVYFPLAPMAEDQLREVITGPAERAGLMVAERLVPRILADVEVLVRRGTPPGITQAMLGAGLYETAKHHEDGMLTIAAYEAVGGVQRVIEEKAERALTRALKHGSEATLRRFFLGLVITGADGRVIRRARSNEGTRRRLARDLEAEDGRGPEAAEKAVHLILTALRGFPCFDGIVYVDRDRVMLCHDVVLHGWPRLRDWQTPEWAAAVPEPAAAPKPAEGPKPAAAPKPAVAPKTAAAAAPKFAAARALAVAPTPSAAAVPGSVRALTPAPVRRPARRWLASLVPADPVQAFALGAGIGFVVHHVLVTYLAPIAT